MTISEALADLKNYQIGQIKLTDDEFEIQKRLSSITMGILCYLNTLEPDIEAFKSRNRPAFGTIPPNEFIIGKNLISKSWFIRAGHFRFLRNDRFHRDEQGNIKCIWVRTHNVNRGEKAVIPDPKIEVLDE